MGHSVSSHPSFSRSPRASGLLLTSSGLEFQINNSLNLPTKRPNNIKDGAPTKMHYLLQDHGFFKLAFKVFEGIFDQRPLDNPAI